MVKTHNFRGAMDYYEASVKKGGQHVLRVDLANLYIKLRLWPNARKVIDAGLLQDRPPPDLDNLMADVKLHMASARINTAASPPDQVGTMHTPEAGLMKGLTNDLVRYIHDVMNEGVWLCFPGKSRHAPPFFPKSTTCSPCALVLHDQIDITSVITTC